MTMGTTTTSFTTRPWIELWEEDLLKQLAEPFPKEALKQRKGGGGKMLDYLETHTVIHRLNSVAGAWTFRILSHEWREDLLIVSGELEIQGLGTRSAFGVQRVVKGGGEDLVKGAASDCLKKCATLFGVGLELYGPDYVEDLARKSAAKEPGVKKTTIPPRPWPPSFIPEAIRTKRLKLLRDDPEKGKSAPPHDPERQWYALLTRGVWEAFRSSDGKLFWAVLQYLLGRGIATWDLNLAEAEAVYLWLQGPADFVEPEARAILIHLIKEGKYLPEGAKTIAEDLLAEVEEPPSATE